MTRLIPAAPPLRPTDAPGLDGAVDEFWGRVAPGRFVNLGERGIGFVRERAGPSPQAPAVILLHGWTATGALNWAALFPMLSQHFRVVAIDQRGHGRGINNRPFSLEDCADDVPAVMDALGIQRAIIGGYSMGGPVAQLVYHRHPGRVSGLVLASTSNSLRPFGVPVLIPWRLAAAALLTVPHAVGDRHWLPALVRIPPLRWVNEWARADPRALFRAGLQISGFQSRSWLPGVTVPVSVVETTLDEMVPPSHQRRMARLMPDVRTFRCHTDHFLAPLGAGHWPRQMLRAFDSVQERVEEREALATRVADREQGRVAYLGLGPPRDATAHPPRMEGSPGGLPQRQDHGLVS